MDRLESDESLQNAIVKIVKELSMLKGQDFENKIKFYKNCICAECKSIVKQLTKCENTNMNSITNLVL